MQRLRFSRYFKVFFILIDVIVITAVFAYFFLRNNNFIYNKNIDEENIILLIIFIFFWILLSGRTKLYNVKRNLTYTIYLERLFAHILFFTFGVILLAKVSNNSYLKQDRYIIAIGLFIILFIIKTFVFFALKYLRTFGINHRNVMFISENASSEVLKNILTTRKDYGYKIFEFPKDKESNIEELAKFWKDNGIHTIYLPSEYSELENNKEREIFRHAEMNKVNISLIPDILQNNYFRFDLAYLETQPILIQSKFPQQYLANYLIKRIFDVVFSLFIIVFICSWLFPIIAFLIKIDSKGSVFFKQKRYGYHDEIFNCLKFRTMYFNNDSDTKTTDKNDKRITKIGKFLRKTSLDEMPQFINVLLGEMSVVGPRPHMLMIDDFYKPQIGRYSIRSTMKPGITGLAQVNGLRGDSGNVKLGMQKRILADTFYVKNWSFSMDLMVIFKTIFLIITGDKKAV